MDIGDFFWFSAFIISLLCLNFLDNLIRSYIAHQAPGIFNITQGSQTLVDQMNTLHRKMLLGPLCNEKKLFWGPQITKTILKLG
jgi:hypothetical protein